MPGRDANLFLSLSYLTMLIILPLLFLVFSLKNVTFEKAISVLSSQRVLDAFRVSFSLSIAAAFFSLLFGVIIAWVLVKYDFFGKKLFDSIVDLPFAMPTAVSGIALASLYSVHGWAGKYLAHFGILVSFTPLGILLALIFVGLPFVVRAVQPAVAVLDIEMEEAAASLGASRATIIGRIIFPQLFPSMMTGFTMSLARGLGEYGSVIFIAGNIPYVTEILPLLIVIELEQFDFESATVLAVAMLSASFALLLVLGLLGNWVRRRYA